MANMTALMAARDTKLHPLERGRAVIYLSEQTHSSVAKGLRILGFLNDQLRKLPADGKFQMDVSALKAAISKERAAGLLPLAVVASCGTTNTGSIDPLSTIADVAEIESLWMHVDGAYGASIVLSQQHQSLAVDLSRADSISWDAHKWLFQTYACGMVLVRALGRMEEDTVISFGRLHLESSCSHRNQCEARMKFLTKAVSVPRLSRIGQRAQGFSYPIV
jgi:L-2,4-diaminobutyrate decarboxylase